MRCIFLFVILFSSFHLHAEIDKNLLVLVKYQDKNLNIEILQYPFYDRKFFSSIPGPSHQGPASYKITEKNCSITEAFQEITPIREQEFRSEKHSVRGFIDAIRHVDEKVHIIDYKTNARFDFKESIKLQLDKHIHNN